MKRIMRCLKAQIYSAAGKIVMMWKSNLETEFVLLDMEGQKEELEEKMLLIEVLHLPTFIETILSHSLTRH